MLLDDTVKSPDDIEKYFGISTLALIPLSEELDDSSYNGSRRKRSKSHKSSGKGGAR
jgi:hypothetical protein